MIRQLGSDELRAVYAIDMTEKGDVVYRVAGKDLVASLKEWQRPPRTPESWDRHIAGWTRTLAGGGAAWGAFDGETMIGIAVLRHHLDPGVAQLSALFVSRPYRRHGIARRLVDRVIAAAREEGAAELYVSATPSRSAVGFYLSRGFRLADKVNDELYALEPEDVHMIRQL
jgi:GNAT superfamily N-acetyltransferase